MTKRSYRGETSSKTVTRSLVWWQHRRLLGSSFKVTPHVFLASRTGKDAEFLLDEGVNPKLVWAVENSRPEYLPLMALRQKRGFVLHTRLIENVMGKHAEAADIRSLFLDYCGTVEGTRDTTQQAVSCMPRNSVVSVTVLRGRELSKSSESRERQLLGQLRSATPHRVTLTQTVRYVSESADTLGSSMETLTFFLGDTSGRGKLKFTLSREVVQGLESPHAIRALWEASVGRALRRRQAAIQANKTRR